MDGFPGRNITKIIEEAERGTESAQWIVEKYKEQKRPKTEDLSIFERCEEYYAEASKIDKLISSRSKLEFSNRTRMGNFVRAQLPKIEEEAERGTESAQWIVKKHAEQKRSKTGVKLNEDAEGVLLTSDRVGRQKPSSIKHSEQLSTSVENNNGKKRSA